MALLLACAVSLGNNVTLAASEIELTQLIKATEEYYKIPTGLLGAIAKVESGFKPYALNIEGKALILPNKEKVKARIEELIEAGISNFDVGIMQLNYRWHGKQFASLDEMVSPKTNIEYAAKLLSNLYRQHKDWRSAIRYYHSASLMHHQRYSRKVIIAWIGGV